MLALSTGGIGNAAPMALTMLLIFGSAKLLHELLERLHQPGIVG